MLNYPLLSSFLQHLPTKMLFYVKEKVKYAHNLQQKELFMPSLTVEIDEDIYESLNVHKKDTGITFKHTINHALKEHLNLRPVNKSIKIEHTISEVK